MRQIQEGLDAKLGVGLMIFTMKSIVEQRPIDSLVLFKIQSVQFIMGPEMSSNRWQFLCED
jgi:hypothetical protein